MKKFSISLVIFLTVFLILIIPIFSFAQTKDLGLIPCDKDCNFTNFMDLIYNVINFVFRFLAVPIAAIMFAYAGFELVTSGGSTEKRGTAKKVFTNAFIGLALAAAAWLIIKTLLVILGYKDIGTFFK